MNTTRTPAQNQAYRIGRAARIRGLDLEAACAELARRLGAACNVSLLVECERGWQSQDELMQPHREVE